MHTPSWKTPGWRGDFTCFAAGILLPLSLAPYNQWLLGILATSVFASLLRGLSARKGFFRAILFGLGMFGSGISWVYISIHDFGNAPLPLAFAMTAIFSAFLAVVFAIPFYFYCKYLSRTTLGFVLGFSAVWVLGEWIRSWLLTGFPWLYVGYAHIDTWLSGWIPIIGVFGVGALATLSGTALAQLINHLENHLIQKNASRTTTIALAATILCIWLSGVTLKKVEWVTPEKDTVSVSIVQPNIPLEMKWQPIYRPYIMDTLRELSEPGWNTDLMIWPEAAVPLLYHEAQEFLAELSHTANESNTALITGILYDDYLREKYLNAVMGLGQASNIYYKQRLVPFGEYVPMEKYLRGLIDFFDMPNSVIHSGPKNQQGIATKHYNVAPYICYEVVYPDLVSENLKDAKIMITISNDAWFGDSIGPLQHFQMAQMRALENGRYMIRATNTGLSGIISHKGEILVKGKQFEPQTLLGKIQLMTGNTPFTRLGSWPTLLICLLFLVLAYSAQRKVQTP